MACSNCVDRVKPARRALAVFTVSVTVGIVGCDKSPTQPTTTASSDVTPPVVQVVPPVFGSDAASMVGAQQARFVFPAVIRAVWPWNLEATKADSSEYVWAVTWKDGGETQQLVCFVMKRTGAAASAGTLAALLEVAACGLWGPSADRAQPTRPARCVAEGDHVVLILDDNRALQALLRERPSTARFSMTLAGQATVSADVELSYQ